MEKALTALQAREVHRTTWDPARMNEVLNAPQRGGSSRQTSAAGKPMHDIWVEKVNSSSGLADLVEIGISAALVAWLS